MPEDSIEIAWTTGRTAGRKRQALASNPYPAGSDRARAWQAGWRDGEGLTAPRMASHELF